MDTAGRDDILLATLPNVAFDGWTDTALQSGAVQAGRAGQGGHVFPGGVPDLIDHFADWTERRMREACPEEDMAGLRTTEKVRRLTKARFEALAPHREAERRLIAYLALPAHLPHGTRLLAKAADDVWHAAGDRATDSSYYTKRLMLGSILAATTLFWLDDDSPGHADTWDFLDRRLADVAWLGRAGANLRRFPRSVAFFPDPRRLARQIRARCAVYVGSPPAESGLI